MTANEDPARVLYYYSHLHADTGAPKVLESLVELVDPARFEPLFLATGDGPLVDALEARDVRIVRGTVEEVEARRPLAALAAVRRQARLLGESSVGLVHVNEFGWNYDLVLAAWLRRIPVILHYHNPGRVVARRNLHRLAADLVLVVSEAHRESIAGRDRLRGRVEVLYNSVDVERFAGGRSIRGELGLAADDYVVVTVAQLSHRKGIDRIVEAAHRLLPGIPELAFLIVGPDGIGERAYADEIRAAVADPALGGRLHLLGSRQDVPDILASSDLFLLPTRSEAFPLVIGEAMAAGLPVITTPVGGIAEIVTVPELGVLVDPPTPDALADQIQRFRDDPDRGRRMGRRAYESLLGRFDRPSIGRRLDALYSELVSMGRRGTGP